MTTFLSCDWGTSSFRLRLVQALDLDILASEISGQGIAPTCRAWESGGPRDRAGRWEFYLQVIHNAITAIEQRIGYTLEQVPVIISGMASSSIGMLELPYGALPFSVDGANVHTHYVAPTADFPHETFLISGVRSKLDVMRGEETQLVGCISDDLALADFGTFIFPGTHSKHIQVKERQAVEFKTFMTGELFELLRRQSILKDAVAGHEAPLIVTTNSSFSQGVQDAVTLPLLHAAFRVRTHHLFGSFTPVENLDYLSGLLIGAELQELLFTDPGTLYLCGGAHLQQRYATALSVLGLTNVVVFSAAWTEEAVIRGQYRIFNQLNS